MDEYSYLSVLLSVILGLAVTQILQGFRGLLLSRTRVQIYWPVIAWALCYCLLLPALVVDVWTAQSTRLDLSPICNGLAQRDPNLHDRGAGLSPTWPATKSST